MSLHCFMPRLQLLAVAVVLCAPGAAMAHSAKAEKDRNKDTHRFGIIGHTFSKGGIEQREQALAGMRDPDLAFVVATGIKGKKEACSDTIYSKRRQMLDQAKRPVIVVPAASDWSDCKNSAGRSISVERLNRLRELLYPEPMSLGARKLELSRMSANPTFRSYAENAYWIHRKVLYATVNISSNNNLYRAEAGRNNEYEDRLVANRFWLNRLFAQARRKKLEAVVLFMEGDLGVLTPAQGLLARLRNGPPKQDGYSAPRKQIIGLAEHFNGKVLLIDTAPSTDGTEPGIAWKGNLGHVSIGARAMQVQVGPGQEELFTLDQP